MNRLQQAFLRGFVKAADEGGLLEAAPMVNNAEGVMDAAVRRPIGRVLTPFLDVRRLNYDPEEAFGQLQASLRRGGIRGALGHIIKDTPSNISFLTTQPIPNETQLFRATLGLPMWETRKKLLGRPELRRLNPKEFTSVYSPEFPLTHYPSGSIMRDLASGQDNTITDAMGGFYRQGTPTGVRYSDLWDVAPEAAGGQSRYDVKSGRLKQLLTRQARWVADAVMKPVEVKGEILYSQLQDAINTLNTPDDVLAYDTLQKQLNELKLNVPTAPIPDLQDRAAFYKKDLGQLAGKYINKGIGAVSEVAPAMGSGLSKGVNAVRPWMSLVSKGLGPLGAGLEIKDVLDSWDPKKYPTSTPLGQAIEENYQQNVSNGLGLRAGWNNMSRPWTAATGGVKNLWDAGNQLYQNSKPLPPVPQPRMVQHLDTVRPPAPIPTSRVTQNAPPKIQMPLKTPHIGNRL